jgi:hypothetical protein
MRRTKYVLCLMITITIQFTSLHSMDRNAQNNNYLTKLKGERDAAGECALTFALISALSGSPMIKPDSCSHGLELECAQTLISLNAFVGAGVLTGYATSRQFLIWYYS